MMHTYIVSLLFPLSFFLVLLNSLNSHCLYCEPPLFQSCYRDLYSYLSKNGPYNLECWNAKSPDGRTVWEGLGDVILLQEVCLCGSPVRFQNPTPFPVPLSLSCACEAGCELSATAPVPCLLPMTLAIMVLNSNYPSNW